MIKLIQDYQTDLGCPYGEFVRSLFRPLPSASMLAHAAMGVVTEVQEALDATSPENALEEAGDIAFFCAAYIQNLPHQAAEADVGPVMKKALLDYCMKHEIQLTNPLDNAGAFGLMQELGIEMLDAAKRYLAYDKAPSPEDCVRLVGCAETIAALSLLTPEKVEGDPQKVIDANVAKLRHRYKGTFSTEQALNRDTQGEMNALSAAVPNA